MYLKEWPTNIKILEEIDAYDLLMLIKDSVLDERKSKVSDNFDIILNRCCLDYNMFNYFTILIMKFANIEKEKCNNQLNCTVNQIFNKSTLLFLHKIFKRVTMDKYKSKMEVFLDTLNELKTYSTEKSSMILFDLYLFPDYAKMLDELHPVISTMINSYQIFNPDVVSTDIFKGSSIIGKLLLDENEKIAEKYMRELLQERHLNSRNVRMIGGGGSSLVFKIKDLVLKLGETRHCRRIYINHRILASIVRKLELTSDEKELFYVEIMKYAKVGDVTEEERDELRKDLYDQGLIWDDDKLENCGVLMDGDDNLSTLPVDYIEVAGNIENPYRREEFMKRKRKVVVIDNDNIRYNPMRSGG